MKKIIIIIIILLYVVDFCHCQFSNWRLISSRGYTSHIFLFPNSKGWIFGGKIAYRTINGGESWENPVIINPSIGGSTATMDMMFSDTLNGWMGIGNEIRKTINGGNSWTTSNVYNDMNIFSIYFVNNTTGWIGGKSYYYPGVLYKTINGGINWFSQNINYWNRVDCIKILNKNKGLISSRNSDTVCYTNNGGETWQKKKIGNGQPITKLFFIDSINGWALGNYHYISRTTDGGLNWTLISTNIGNTRSIYFINMNTGWVGTPGGYIWKTTNGGINWFVQKQFYYGGYNNESYVENIIFKNEMIGFAVFGCGTVMKTTDGGNNWNNSINTPLGDIVSVSFIDDNNGLMLSYYIGEENSLIWKTTNGGLNWLNTDTSKTKLYSITYINNLTGFVCGNHNSPTYSIIKKTTDGGFTWDSTAINNIIINKLFFVDANTGWGCGNYGVMCKTTNSGNSWSNQVINTQNVHDVYFLDNQTGFAALDSGVIMKTTNGGINWLTENTSYVYNYNSVHFTNANIGYAVGYKFYSQYLSYYTNRIVVKTTNGGNNWLAILNELAIYGQHAFNDIFFINDSTGWIIKDEGVILKTVNGGTNWFSDLTYDGKLYGIQFVNKDKGWAVGERGVLFITGQNTGISHLNKNIPIKFLLSQNFPNPFNPNTYIRYQIANNKHVTLKIFDVLGKEVATPVNEKQSPGTYEVSWDGSSYPSGVYYYRLTAGDYSETKKMVLVK